MEAAMKLEATDQAAIRRLVKKYVTAFNQQKPRACASVYAADGDLIGVDGVLTTGPAAIEELYRKLFTQFPTAKVHDAKTAPARVLAGSAALANGTWKVHGVTPDPIDVVGTFVVRRTRGVWSFAAVRLMTAWTGP
jgi:uncharacterized protein (TIGR02246 family)